LDGKRAKAALPRFHTKLVRIFRAFIEATQKQYGYSGRDPLPYQIYNMDELGISPSETWGGTFSLGSDQQVRKYSQGQEKASTWTSLLLVTRADGQLPCRPAIVYEASVGTFHIIYPFRLDCESGYCDKNANVRKCPSHSPVSLSSLFFLLTYLGLSLSALVCAVYLFPFSCPF
jgi:hypothetical protein